MGTKQNRIQNCKKDQLFLCKYIKGYIHVYAIS